MQRLIKEDPKNLEVIFPYIGGEELNSHPSHAHHRYVINFWDYPLRRDPNPRRSWFKASDKRRKQWLREGLVPHDYPNSVAEDWPELLQIVETRVKPDRSGLNDKTLRARWWRFARTRPELHSAIERLDRVLAISRVGQHVAFCFLPNGMVYADSTIIFPFDTYAALCVLQSRPHEVWSRCFGSSMKDDLRYTPSDCFETFPFPRDWSINPRLEVAAKEYYEFRAGLMQSNGEGLTKTYNRFHDRYENDPDIARLRQLHDEMDRAVLCEYGWDDIPLRCEFLSDLGSEEESTSKRFWRYRWPDDICDEVLGRLIELNAKRAREEREREESASVDIRAEPKALGTPADEVQSEASPFLIPPPLFASDDE